MKWERIFIRNLIKKKWQKQDKKYFARAKNIDLRVDVEKIGILRVDTEKILILRVDTQKIWILRVDTQKNTDFESRYTKKILFYMFIKTINKM